MDRIYPSSELDEVYEKRTFDINDFRNWDPETLTDYLESQNVPVGRNLIDHKINGDLLDDLTDDDYAALGYTWVGEKFAVRKAIFDLQNRERNFVSFAEYLSIVGKLVTFANM